MAAVTVLSPIVAPRANALPEGCSLLALPREILSHIGEYAATGPSIDEAARNGVVFGRVCSLAHSIALENRQMEAVRYKKILELFQMTVVKLVLERPAASEENDILLAQMCYVVFKQSLGKGENFPLRAREALRQLRLNFAIAATVNPGQAALSVARCPIALREFAKQIIQDMVAGSAGNSQAITPAIQNFFAQERTLSQDVLLDRKEIERIIKFHSFQFSHLNTR